MNNIRTTLQTSLIAVLLSWATSVPGAVIIDFGGDMVTGNRSFALPDPVDDGNIRIYPYDFDTPISPTSSDYTGILFYGVLQNESGKATPANFTRARITNNGANDELDVWGNSDADEGVSNIITGLIFFRPELAVGETVEFLSGDSISLTASIPGGDPRRTRIAVLNDGVWYLSDSSSHGSLEVEDAANELWAEWDPTAIPLPEPPEAYGTAGADFQNIEAVGVWFASGREDSNGRFYLREFKVHATVAE